MKRILSLSIALLFGVNAFAQNSSELGVCTGFTGYLGDLQSIDYTYRNPGFVMGVFGRLNPNPFFSMRAFLNIGNLNGNDKYSPQLDHRTRNLSFRSNIYEVGLVGEYNILPFDDYNPYRNTNRRHFNCTPFIYGGINVFHFNPKAYYQGEWVALQPLHTEGQNSQLSNIAAYNRTQFGLPFGIGVKYIINPKMMLSVDIGYRKTFTDYLDDVSGRYVDENELRASQGNLSADLSYRTDELNGDNSKPLPGDVRGNPDNKDWYLMNTISFSYKFFDGYRH